jgi:hypothetical protein
MPGLTWPSLKALTTGDCKKRDLGPGISRVSGEFKHYTRMSA